MTLPPKATFLKRTGMTAAILALAGCASFSSDGGFDNVEQLTRERTGVAPRFAKTADDTQSAQTRVKELLAAPLTADSAVELALLNNPGLQGAFASLASRKPTWCRPAASEIRCSPSSTSRAPSRTRSSAPSCSM
ncbi:MAG: hypothetical protein IPK29_20160 [Betaproteobacteria bacterium]|nr:hypothetical protein [Betaproteobacteria bacterium]